MQDKCELLSVTKHGLNQGTSKLVISFKMSLKRKKRNRHRTFADAFLTCNVSFISARRCRGYVCAEPYSFCDIDM